MTTTTNINDLVSFEEVAAMCGVQKSTVWAWSSRGVLPSPVATVSGHPLWTKQVIEEWASRTGRTITY